MWTGIIVFVSVLVALVAVLQFAVGPSGADTAGFQGKRAVITGASSGIGEQLAYRFCEHGADVVLVARRRDALSKVAEQCRVLGAASVTYIASDLSNIEGTKNFSQEVLTKFKTIDVLVLNHITYDVQRWHGNRSIDDAIKAFNTNVISYINLATLFLPSLQASHGRLVVMSSGLGIFTYPYFTLYCANKHALHGFFNALRQDLALDAIGDDKGMSITITVLGPIKTESALQVSQGNPVAGEAGWTRLSPIDASTAVVDAALRRERQAYFPYAMKLHELASFHFPSLMDKLIHYIYGLS